MQLPDPADRLPVQYYAGTAAWMQSRVHGLLKSRVHSAHQDLQIALYIEEVQAASRDAPLLLVRRPEGRRRDSNRLTYAGDIEGTFRCTGRTEEHTSNLEDTHAGRAPIDVIAHVGHQPRNEGAAHDRALARNRVQQLDRRGVPGKVQLPLRLGKAEIEDFLIVERSKVRAQRMQRADRLRLRPHRGTRERRQRWNLVEPVNPRNLLDQILFDLQIEAV